MAKRKITHNQLKHIVVESVRSILKEAGNLYVDHEDGSFSTNAKTPYRNVPDSIYIWHGEWSDPEIYYGGYLMNYYDIEDTLYDRWKEFAEENGLDVNDDDEYEKYANEYAQDALDDCAFALSEAGEKPRKRT